MTEPKYNGGGVIPGNPGNVEVRLQVGERLITTDQTVYELQEVEGGWKWVKIGHGYALWMEGT